MKKSLAKWLLPMIVILNACSKDDVNPGPPVLTAAKGLYILSEGSSNNSKLGYYNLATGVLTGDFFGQQNPSSSGLGSLANDMIQYGSKLYIVMNGSSNVTVLNASNAVFIKQIPFINGSVAMQPRYAASYKGNVYVTSTIDSSVSVIDTSSLSIIKTIHVGRNPEGLAIVGNKMYVANSGGYTFGAVDSTVSVIDLNTQTEIKRIKTATKNGQRVDVNSMGDVYVSGYGDFADAPASVSIISSITDNVKLEMGPAFGYSNVRIYDDVAYFYNTYGGTGTCKLYNTITNTVLRPEFITDGTLITNAYGINVDEQNGDVYILDSKSFPSTGVANCFDKNGVKKFSFSVSPGVGPNKVLFIR
ncbi:MAG: hypothetical protein ABIP30_16270 [Ferruginibacter sp.]